MKIYHVKVVKKNLRKKFSKNQKNQNYIEAHVYQKSQMIKKS